MNNSADFGSFWQQLYLAWQLWRDPETPFFLKLLPLGAVLYWLFPLEGMAFPILATPLDDVAVMFVALKTFINLAPPHLVARYTNPDGAQIVEGEYERLDENDPIPPHKQGLSLEDDIVLNPDKWK
jgi:uncharacterized membrane protein YkvA (DUF1232 family)